MNNPKVSIVVPVYNSEKYLGKCLDSLINQSLKDIEIICVDDGSTDTSPYILNEYSKKDDRIKVITQENKDVGAARGTGVKASKGEFIAFIDNDDWFALDAMEKLYKNAKSNGSDFVIFKVVFYYDNKDSYVYPPQYDYKKYFKEGTDFNNFVFTAEDVKFEVMNRVFAPWFKFYKSDFLNSYDDFYFKENITYPDVPLHVQSMLRAKKISYCDEDLYFYRRGHFESMLTLSSQNNRVFDIFTVIDEVEDFLIYNGFMKDYRVEFSAFLFLQVFLWYRRTHESLHKKFFKIAKSKIDKLNISSDDLKNFNDLILEAYNSFTKCNTYLELDLLNEIKIHERELLKIERQRDKYKNDLSHVKKEVKLISNTKPYRLAYFIRRFSSEFIKGNLKEKKNFLKWVYLKIIRKNQDDHKYNVLYKISK